MFLIWGWARKYSKAFVNSGLNAVLYDLPDTIDYVKTQFGLGNIKNLILRKGDFTNDFVNEFTGELFDIVFMGNICHIYSEKDNRKLIKRASNILKKRRYDRNRGYGPGTKPHSRDVCREYAGNTEDGNTYTEAQYREWLTDDGFRKIEIIDLAQKSNQLITAFWG